MSDEATVHHHSAAWFAVWDLCVEMGMDTNTDNTGLEDVLAFIKSLPNKGLQSDCCPRCGSNSWRDAITPDTLEICTVCGNSR